MFLESNTKLHTQLPSYIAITEEKVHVGFKQAQNDMPEISL